MLGLSAAIAAFGTATPCRAQNSVQTWYDVEFNYQAGPRLLANLEVGPKVLVSGAAGWNSVDVSPGLEYSPTPQLDLLAYVPLSQTVQVQGLNTFEMRLSSGFRYTFRLNQRLFFRNRTLFEYRSIDFQDSDSAQTSSRFRTRVEARAALNKPTYAANHMLYGIADFEVFANLGAPPSERFLNRTRFRAGLGYRFSHYWRTEVLYTLQTSKNTLNDGEDVTADQIIRLRLVHYLK